MAETSQELRDKIDKAHAEVSAICNGKKWRMSIPAQMDSDSDLVIGTGLEAGRDALDEIARLQAEVARLQGEATEREAILAAMYCAATQQPVSDFEESFPAVRAVADLAAEKTQAEAEREALRATLAAVREKQQNAASLLRTFPRPCGWLPSRFQLIIDDVQALLDGTAPKWPELRDSGRPNRWHEFQVDPETQMCVICGWAKEVHGTAPEEGK